MTQMIELGEKIVKITIGIYSICSKEVKYEHCKRNGRKDKVLYRRMYNKY